MSATNTPAGAAPAAPAYPAQVTGMDILVRALNGRYRHHVRPCRYSSHRACLYRPGPGHPFCRLPPRTAGRYGRRYPRLPHPYAGRTPYSFVARLPQRSYRDGKRHRELLSDDTNQRFECARAYRPASGYLRRTRPAKHRQASCKGRLSCQQARGHTNGRGACLPSRNLRASRRCVS